MSIVNAPFGFEPTYHPSGQQRDEPYVNGVSSGYATALYHNAPVTLNANGNIIAVTATGVDILGVFRGIDYTDASGVPHNARSWLANTNYLGNSTAYICRDENTIYRVQSDGSIAASPSPVGNQVVVSNFLNAGGTGETARSQCTVSATPVGSGNQGQFRVVAFDPKVDNTPGDAFTSLYVENARPLYRALKTAV